MRRRGSATTRPSMSRRSCGAGPCPGISTANILLLAVWFMGALKIEGIHPLEVGWIRRKNRLQRRSGMPIEPALLFYPKYWIERTWKLMRWGALYLRFGARMLKVEWDKNRMSYTDKAMTVGADEDELELFQSTDAKAWIEQEKRLDRARHGVKDKTPAEAAE